MNTMGHFFPRWSFSGAVMRPHIHNICTIRIIHIMNIIQINLLKWENIKTLNLNEYGNIYNAVWDLFKAYYIPMTKKDNEKKWELLDAEEKIQQAYNLDFTDHLLTAAHKELMALFDRRVTGNAHYFQIYSEVCELFKKYFPEIPDDPKNGEYWRNLIRDASDISEKWCNNRFCMQLLFATTDELERIHKEKVKK